MKLLVSRTLSGIALALVAWLLLVGADAPRKSAGLQPDKLIILSTVDAKGKTSPCG